MTIKTMISRFTLRRLAAFGIAMTLSALPGTGLADSRQDRQEQWGKPELIQPTPEMRRVIAALRNVNIPEQEIDRAALVDLNGDGQAELAFRWVIPANSPWCRQASPCQRHGVAVFTASGPERGWRVVALRSSGALEIQRTSPGQWAKIRFRQTPLTEASVGIASEVWVPTPNGTYVASAETIPARIRATTVPKDSPQGREILAALNALGGQQPELAQEAQRMTSFRVAQWRVSPSVGQRASSRNTPSAQNEELATIQLVTADLCGTSARCPVVVLHRTIQPVSPWRAIGIVWAAEGQGEPYLPDALDGRQFLLVEPGDLVLYGLDANGRLTQLGGTIERTPWRF